MVLSAVIALLVTAITTPTVIRGMRRLAAVDTVTERSSHRIPTYRGGGVAVVLGLFAGMLVPAVRPGADASAELLILILAVALFGLLGLAEDIHGIAALRRLGLQMVAAAGILTAWIVATHPDLPVQAVPFAAAVALVWITGFTNAFNFMDGINGISTGQTLVAGVAFAVIGQRSGLEALSYGGAAAVGAALGFGPYNFPRARIFLGDVGSYALGALIATLALIAVGHGVRPDTVAAPLLVYLADTSFTLVRRVRAGQVWCEPHRSHVYQLLTVSGWSHTRAAFLVSSVTATTAVLGLVAYSASLPVRLASDALAVAVVCCYLALPRYLTVPGRDGSSTARPTVAAGPRTGGQTDPLRHPAA
ncbi:glycosyltransferase family 4 protein [Frankia sp. Cppng1_Ct_nod]|uniref:MraY family glycosyltransferase n=1 Tax=Frankia sp. Cppng1_Ct_nod TaxID=2897162 RepID=UPI001F5E70F0|nr:glycosyltransferase family 4 protein [Frankia sp. Cppng1_Ct_nod]